MPTTQDQLNLAAAKQAHFDNGDFRETGSIAKAEAFVSACRRLIGLYPKSGQHGGAAGEAFSFDLPTLREERRDAERWIAAMNRRSGSPQFVHGDFSNFKGDA